MFVRFFPPASTRRQDVQGHHRDTSQGYSAKVQNSVKCSWKRRRCCKNFIRNVKCCKIFKYLICEDEDRVYLSKYQVVYARVRGEEVREGGTRRETERESGERDRVGETERERTPGGK